MSSWVRVLRPGGHVLINSGNIRNPRARRNEWILDETVWVVGEIAEGLVRTDPAYAAYLPALDDTERMAAHAAFRDKVFFQPRPLDFYVETLELAGLKVESVREASIEAHVASGPSCSDVQRRRARLGRRHGEDRRRSAVPRRSPTGWG